MVLLSIASHHAGLTCKGSAELADVLRGRQELGNAEDRGYFFRVALALLLRGKCELALSWSSRFPQPAFWVSAALLPDDSLPTFQVHFCCLYVESKQVRTSVPQSLALFLLGFGNIYL